MTENKQPEAAGGLNGIPAQREITIAGECVSVQSFDYGQSIKAAEVIRPMLMELRELYKSEDAEALQYRDIAEVFGRHSAAFVELLAISIGRPTCWIERLSDRDGNLLAMTFWVVNARYFTRQLVTQDIDEILRRKDQAQNDPNTYPDVFLA